MKALKQFSFRQKIRIALKEFFLTLISTILYSTLRVELIDPAQTLARAARGEQRAIFAVFHHSYLIPFFLNRGKRYVTLTADNEAGEVLTRMISRLGFTAVRVPSDDNPKAGARAAIRMIELLRENHPGAIAVDGPEGPYEQVKPGIFSIAHKTEAKIYPGAFGMKHELVLHKRWDKFRIPLPFSRVVAVCGEPFEFTVPLTKESIEKDCVRLEETLRTLTRQANALV